MKREVSAGGIIVRKSGKQWDVLLLKDMNNNWTFPKGLVEKDEEAVACAKREIFEEVGLTDISLLTPLKPIRYLYQRNGLISKTVQYFLFSYEGTQTPKGQKEEGISDVRWVPLDKALEIIGYAKTNRPLLKEVKSYAARKSAGY